MQFHLVYGVVGMAAMPYFVLIELLGPVIEGLGYISFFFLLAMGAVDLDMAPLFFIAAFFYGVMFSVGAVLLEEISFKRYPKLRHLILLISFGVIENFGYRQMTMWWRLMGFWDYFRGKQSWGAMQRKGFNTPTPKRRVPAH
jgi:hypothetical protein